jgi:hypothetical protein
MCFVSDGCGGHPFRRAAEASLLDEMNERLELLHRQVLQTVGSHTPFLLLKISRRRPSVPQCPFSMNPAHNQRVIITYMNLTYSIKLHMNTGEDEPPEVRRWHGILDQVDVHCLSSTLSTD